jgi:L-ascorbate metabolism protein UlaG (beta-lactamase superfamily)
MKKPLFQHQILRDQILKFDASFALGIWWLGQSGFLIKSKQRYILFDPYLSDTLSIKYQFTDKPHTRISEIVIDPNLLPPMHLIFSSHNHTDHLDAATLNPIISKSPDVVFVIPEANRDFIADRLGCDLYWPFGVNDDKEYTIDGIKIIPIAAAHNAVERNEKGDSKFLSYLVKVDGLTFYHSGDTIWYTGLEDELRKHEIDVAFLPINGNKPERKVAGNLNYLEAAALAKTIKAKLTLPHHYDLFEFNTEDPELFARAAGMLQINYKVLQLGEGIEISYPKREF